MVVNYEINTIDNQPEVIQPLEVEKSHLISIEENSTKILENAWSGEIGIKRNGKNKHKF